MSDKRLINYRDEIYSAYVLINDYNLDCDLNICEVGFSRTPPGFSSGPGVRKTSVLQYIVSGEGYFNDMYIKKGDGFFSCGGEVFKLESSENNPIVSVWIMFEGLKLSEYMEFAGIKLCNQVFDVPFIKSAVKEIKTAVFSNYEKKDLRLYLQSVFFKILSLHRGAFTEKTAESELDRELQYVNKAILYINENIGKKITIKEISDFVNISQNYMCKLFNKKKHCTPQQFLLIKRMEYAKKLLMRTNIYICEIARAVGHSDSMYFSKVFKDYTGFTPTQYRKNGGQQ